MTFNHWITLFVEMHITKILTVCCKCKMLMPLVAGALVVFQLFLCHRGQVEHGTALIITVASPLQFTVLWISAFRVLFSFQSMRRPSCRIT